MIPFDSYHSALTAAAGSISEEGRELGHSDAARIQEEIMQENNWTVDEFGLKYDEWCAQNPYTRESFYYE